SGQLVGLVAGVIYSIPATTGVDAVAKILAPRSTQGVFGESFARTLQQRAIDFWRKSTAGQDMSLVALVSRCSIFKPPAGILLADIKWRLETRRGPDFFWQRNITRTQLPARRHHRWLWNSRRLRRFSSVLCIL